MNDLGSPDNGAAPAAPARDPSAPPRRKRLIPRVPMRMILPSLVTLIALCAGLTAIRFTLEARFEPAMLAIVVAAVLDGLDGRLARALKSTTRFGAELDSLADFIDFGVAPAMLLYWTILRLHPGLGWVAAMIFAIAAALRLARFNVMIDEDKPAWAGNFFAGMPAPAGALVGMLPLYIHLLGWPITKPLATFAVAYVLVVALLMVSRIPHFSGKQVGRVPRDALPFVLFGVLALLMLLATYTTATLTALSVFYLALIPFSVMRYRAFERAETPAPPKEA
jgi:CDP-diacylglycerol--serine O-phosphatidyltransferase